MAVMMLVVVVVVLERPLWILVLVLGFTGGTVEEAQDSSNAVGLFCRAGNEEPGR